MTFGGADFHRINGEYVIRDLAHDFFAHVTLAGKFTRILAENRLVPDIALKLVAFAVEMDGIVPALFRFRPCAHDVVLGTLHFCAVAEHLHRRSAGNNIDFMLGGEIGDGRADLTVHLIAGDSEPAGAVGKARADAAVDLVVGPGLLEINLGLRSKAADFLYQNIAPRIIGRLVKRLAAALLDGYHIPLFRREHFGNVRLHARRALEAVITVDVVRLEFWIGRRLHDIRRVTRKHAAGNHHIDQNQILSPFGGVFRQIHQNAVRKAVADHQHFLLRKRNERRKYGKSQQYGFLCGHVFSLLNTERLADLLLFSERRGRIGEIGN